MAEEICYSKRFGYKMKHREMQADMNSSSAVWNFFDCFVAVDDNGEAIKYSDGREIKIVKCRSAECRRTELRHPSSSTSHMIRHLEKMHSSLSPLFSWQKYRKRSREEAATDSEDAELGECSHASEKMHELVFNHIIDNGLPFSVVRSATFKAMMKPVYPKCEVPDVYQLKCLMREKIADCELKRNSLLEYADRPVLLMIEWSLPTVSRSYFAMYLCGCSKLFGEYNILTDIVSIAKSNHDAETLAEKAEDAIRKCGVDFDAIVGVVSDGAPGMRRLATSIGKWWLPSLTHRTDWVVRAILERVEGVLPLLKKVRSNLRIINSSSSLRKLLANAQNSLNMKEQQLEEDNPSRWDSVLGLFRLFIANVEAVNVVADSAENNRRRITRRVRFITPDEVQLMKCALRCLEVFREMILYASEKEETMASFIPAILNLKIHLEEMLKTAALSKLDEQFITEAIEEVSKHFFLAHSDTGESDSILENRLLLQATFFHPLYSHTKLLSQSQWQDISSSVRHSVTDYVMEKKKATLEDNATESKVFLTPKQNHNLPASFDNRLRQVLPLYDAGSSSFLDENTLRLQVDMEIRNFLYLLRNADAATRQLPYLTFWKKFKNQLPSLADYARIASPAPILFVDCERLFGRVPRLLSEKCRSQLLDSTVRDVVMIKEWLIQDNLGTIYTPEEDWSDYDFTEKSFSICSNDEEFLLD